MNVESLAAHERTALRANVLHAIEAHHLWVGRLKTAIDTGRSARTPAEVADPLACDIGQWLTQTFPVSLRTSPEYRTTLDRHADFHRILSQTLDGALRRDPRAAAAILPDGAFSVTARALRTSLNEWLRITPA